MIPAASVVMACEDGITSIEGIAHSMTHAEWDRPTPCAEWDAASLLGHAACMAEDYSTAINCFLGGSDNVLLLGQDIDQHNAMRLQQISCQPVMARLDVFSRMARAAIWSAAGAWHSPAFDHRGQRWTIGRYAAMCALEWHLHAWDLHYGCGLPYRPLRPAVLADIWEWMFPCNALPGGDPWRILLSASGRDPDITISTRGSLK